MSISLGIVLQLTVGGRTPQDNSNKRLLIACFGGPDDYLLLGVASAVVKVVAKPLLLGKDLRGGI